MLSTNLNTEAPVRAWTIFANGVAVWTQIAMFAPKEIAQIVEDFQQ